MPRSTAERAKDYRERKPPEVDEKSRRTATLNMREYRAKQKSIKVIIGRSHNLPATARFQKDAVLESASNLTMILPQDTSRPECAAGSSNNPTEIKAKMEAEKAQVTGDATDHQEAPGGTETVITKKCRKDMTLLLECCSDGLSEEQTAYYESNENEFKEFLRRWETLLSSPDTRLIEQGKNVSILECCLRTDATGNVVIGKQVPPLVVKSSQKPQNNQILIQQPNGNLANNYQLVMDPSGLIVGAVSSTGSSPAVSSGVSNNSMVAISPAPPPQTTVQISRQTAKRGGGRGGRVYGPSQGAKSTMGVSSKTVVRRPHESTSIGGLVAGMRTRGRQPPTSAVVDLTEDEAQVSSSDNREVAINKMSGKTYPSLVVVARPHLVVKGFSQATLTAERLALDNKVKKVLMVNASGFTEWLLQQGLLRCEQWCSTHSETEGQPFKLKLGMYSDASKFPYSGGYVWISECCPQQFVSVFSGSIFEGAPHPPTVLLKLLYHWACHTGIQNVVQWVKVDNLYVKNLYTNLRAVCTAALHNKYQKMGGNQRKIQVGVISLGTTTQDGNCRQVKVEVLGVLDPESKNLRIRAIEPVHEGEQNYKMRFMKILEPLQHWVEKDSVILTDYTVDKGTLIEMGYNTVYQISATEPPLSQTLYSNQNIMEYLRKIVPRMFQNTLSLLSRQIIQQFLDELVWRERWGPIPSRAFSSIVEHIAEQTKLDTGGTLLNRLAKIAANPFKNWKYDRWAANCKVTPLASASSQSSGTPPPMPQQPSTSLQSSVSPTLEMLTPIAQVDMVEDSVQDTVSTTTTTTTTISGGAARRGRGVGIRGGARNANFTPRSSAPALPLVPEVQGDSMVIPLEPYFYAILPGDPDKMINNQFPTPVKCVICSRGFKNNIQLMEHLIKHALNKSSNDQKELCKFCYKVTTSHGVLRIHHSQSHKEGSITQLTCLICSIKLRDKSTFISHMSRIHYEMEMPYICYICRYRTSVHDKMVKHFYDVHDGSDYGICPYCFKIVDFFRDGEEVTQNQYFYLTHIQKHQLSPLTKKCSRCAMWFINKAVHDEHESLCHHSCRNLPGAERFRGLEYLMMPPPPGDPAPSRIDRSKTPQSTINFKVSNFRALKLRGVSFQTRCAECEAEINDDHFLGHLSCTKCKYQTCCQRAMTEHNSSAHFTYTPRFIVGRPVKLERLIYCACSFSTKNGHAMANHLVQCGAVTCYTNRAVASRRSSVTTVIDDEQEEEMQWTHAYTTRHKDKGRVVSEEQQPKNVLNFLGLVRKSSTDDNSRDGSATMDSENSVATTPTTGENSLLSQPQLGLSAPKKEKEDRPTKMVVDPDVIEIMDYEEPEEGGSNNSNNKMAVDASPSPEAMLLDD